MGWGAKLPSGRAAGLAGMERLGWKRYLYNTGEHNCTTSHPWQHYWPGPTSQYCQTAPYLLFAYAEIMKNYSTVIIIIYFKECLISLNNPENIVIYLSAVTGFAHPMSNFVFPHHHPSYKRNGQGHPLLSPRA